MMSVSLYMSAVCLCGDYILIAPLFICGDVDTHVAFTGIGGVPFFHGGRMAYRQTLYTLFRDLSYNCDVCSVAVCYFFCSLHAENIFCRRYGCPGMPGRTTLVLHYFVNCLKRRSVLLGLRHR